MYKMGKELVFNNGHNNCYINKCYFQKDKKPINIDEVDTNKIVLSNNTPYGEKCDIKYYIPWCFKIITYYYQRHKIAY